MHTSILVRCKSSRAALRTGVAFESTRWLAICDGNLVTHLDLGPRGAAFNIPTAVVPPLLVAHIMSFWLLLAKDPSNGVST